MTIAEEVREACAVIVESAMQHGLAAEIRAFGLSQFEPKENVRAIVQRLELWKATTDSLQDSGVPLNGPALVELLKDAESMIESLSAQLNRLKPEGVSMLTEEERRMLIKKQAAEIESLSAQLAELKETADYWCDKSLEDQKTIAEMEERAEKAKQQLATERLEHTKTKCGLDGASDRIAELEGPKFKAVGYVNKRNNCTSTQYEGLPDGERMLYIAIDNTILKERAGRL